MQHIGKLPDECVVVLTKEEIHQISDIVASLQQRFPNKSSPHQLSESIDCEVLEAVRVSARLLLPDRLRQILLDFRQESNSYGALMIRGFDVGELPDTPIDWQSSDEKSSTVSEYTIHLFNSLLGEPIAFADARNGRLISDVVPVAGMEHERANVGSILDFEFHVEIGFHLFKPDYLTLLCLRSDHERKAITAVTSIERAMRHLTKEQISVLEKPIFTIGSSFSFGRKMTSCPVPIISYNSNGRPQLRVVAAAMVLGERRVSRGKGSLSCLEESP